MICSNYWPEIRSSSGRSRRYAEIAASAPLVLLDLGPTYRDVCLQSAAPAVLPREAHCVKAVSGAGGHPGACIKLDRILPIDRQRHGHSHARVFLQIVAAHAIDGRAPSSVVSPVHRHPYTGSKAVDEMSLYRVERILLARLATKEIAVVRIERGGRGEFERQWPPRLGGAELRLDGPAVGADVDEPVRIVLAKRRCHLQARADDDVLPVDREVLQQKCRSA